MAVLIFANGELRNHEWVDAYVDDRSIIVAADGGVHHLLGMGKMPDVVIGDLDSLESGALSDIESAGVKINSYSHDKDETDLELAVLWAAERFQEDIIIFGALGGRLDQSLGNLLLLAHPKLSGNKVEIREENQRAWLVAGKSQIDGIAGDIVSLIPLDNDVRVQQTSGLRWGLTDEVLTFGMTRGISNEMIADKASIILESGRLLCVQTSR